MSKPPVQHITQSMRENLSGYLVRRARNPGLYALHAEGNKLFAEVVTLQWREFATARSEKPGLFYKTARRGLNLGVRGTRTLELFHIPTDEDGLMSKPCRGEGLAIPNVYRSDSDKFVPGEALMERLADHLDAVATYERETTDLGEKTFATLSRLNTVRKLAEGWPEAYEAVKHLIPEPKAPPQLPVKLDIMNAALGLPVDA